MERDRIATAALARNDRYVREFVETLQMCPYARRCREEGKLHRRVLLPGDDALEAVREIEAMPVESVEVALLIFPEGHPEPRGFEEFVSGLRQAVSGAFYCVAFHPLFPRDLDDEHRAVPFIRRSPDPTMQMVRASVLRAVRGNNDSERYIDISRLSTAEILALEAPVPVSDRIAKMNLQTLQSEGADRVEALLSGLRPGSDE
jgi:hypothetical protein